jgi:hypothetical protein
MIIRPEKQKQKQKAFSRKDAKTQRKSKNKNQKPEKCFLHRCFLSVSVTSNGSYAN